MFGSQNFAASEYAKISVQTSATEASPIKIIIMLYDGAISACYGAIRAIESKDYAKKSTLISKAINIIEGGLQTSLDKKEGGDIAKSLDDLYTYMIMNLYNANLNNEKELLSSVGALLKDLRTSWELIEEKGVA